MKGLRITQIVAGVLIVGWGVDQLVETPGERASPVENGAAPGSVAAAGTGAPVPEGVRPLTNENSVRVVPHGSGHCKAFAPADWQVQGFSPRGDIGELVSADGRSYAAWGIRGVNRIQEPYQGPLYGDPMTSSRVMLAAAAAALGDGSAFAPVGSPTRFGDDYVAQELRSSANRGLIVYRTYPAGPMYSPDSYIISLRMAIAPLAANDFAIKTAAGVAASINCTTQFVPPRNNDVEIPTIEDVHSRRRQRESDELADYNVQLGTQPFHSPTTGETILVDRSTAITSGPQGQGVYRRVGNSYELLTPGRAP